MKMGIDEPRQNGRATAIDVEHARPRVANDRSPLADGHDAPPGDRHGSRDRAPRIPR
jgi:hypothetical protein